MSENKKTSAKRVGVKSAFVRGDGNLVVASFGRGAAANIAYRSDRDANAPLPFASSLFSLDAVDPQIDVFRGSGANEIRARIPNPVLALTDERFADFGKDYLLLKDAFEEEVFGARFPKDNVRVQIAYNIFDVQKIVGVYVADVVYAIDNLALDPEKKASAELGLSLNKENVKQILEKLSPYFGFFGSAFQTLPKKPQPTEAQKAQAEKRNAQVLQVLGLTRQFTAHFKDSVFIFGGGASLVKAYGSHWKIVEEDYRRRVEKINADFAQTSRMNLGVLADLYGIADATAPTEARRDLAREYYRFAILKEGKNLGVNLKKTRELLVEKYYSTLVDPDAPNAKKYNSFRSKIHAIFDCLLFRWAKTAEETTATRERLRETPDDDAKERVYREFADAAYVALRRFLDRFFAKIRNGLPQEYLALKNSADADFDASWLDGVRMNPSDAAPLVQLLSFLSNFWEAKEINEILTAFIRKFESVQAFIDLLDELGDKPSFVAPKYALFNELNGKMAGKIAEQLRVLASVGKMKPDMESAKRVLYKAAVETLGYRREVDDEWLERTFWSEDRCKPTRNFFANNVVKSRRFAYLVRYTTPRTVRATTSNRAVVRYVLSRLPETQIDSYFRNIEPIQKKQKETPLDEKIDRLTERLVGFSFEDYQTERATAAILSGSRKKEIQKLVAETRSNAAPRLSASDLQQEREILKALTGLYLTVAYVAIKNLVKANARYYIAFAILERDLATLRKLKGDKALKSFELPFEYVDPKDGETKTGSNDLLVPLRYYLDREAKLDAEYEAKKAECNARHPNDVEGFRAEFRPYFNSIRRHYKPRWRRILEQNAAEALAINETGHLLTWARNDAAHLNALKRLPEFIGDFLKDSRRYAESYFEIYHYIQQRITFEKEGLSLPPKLVADVKKTGAPSSDLIKLAYASLGYCLPRYQNLTTDALFDPDAAKGRERAKRLKKEDDAKRKARQEREVAERKARKAAAEAAQAEARKEEKERKAREKFVKRAQRQADSRAKDAKNRGGKKFRR